MTNERLAYPPPLLVKVIVVVYIMQKTQIYVSVQATDSW